MRRTGLVWIAIVCGMVVVAGLWRWRGRRVSVERVAAQLADPAVEVRLATATALGTVRAVQTVPAMAARLTQEPDPRVREALCFALAQAGTHEAARALGGALGDPVPSVADRAHRALESLYRRPLPADPAAAQAWIEREPPP